MHCPKKSIVGQRPGTIVSSAKRGRSLLYAGHTNAHSRQMYNVSVAFEETREILRVDAALLLKQLLEKIKFTPNEAISLWRSCLCKCKGAGLQTRSRRSPFQLLYLNFGENWPSRCRKMQSDYRDFCTIFDVFRQRQFRAIHGERQRARTRYLLHKLT